MSIKIFFATDIHGSNVCFRKFLNALPIYGADVAILLGDLTGKVMVPVVEGPKGRWQTNLIGNNIVVESPEELARVKQTVENAGYYWVNQTMEEFVDTSADKAKTDALFKRLVLQRLNEWVELANERMAAESHRHRSLYMAAGNDDWSEVDAILNDAGVIQACDMRVVPIDGHEMVTCSWSNPTPWHTPRELPEDELEAMLDGLCAQVHDYEKAIFNFHVPPYGYSLDRCPKLDENLVMAADETIHAGSLGARRMIEKYKPLLGLHGHIHESRSAQRAGRTLMVNPGSEYSEGILRGVVLVLDEGKVKDYAFTAG